MNLNIEQITQGALSLPGEARALLADRLVESPDPADDGRLHSLWAAEAQQRLQDVRTGKVKTIPGPDALERVRRSVARHLDAI